MWGIDDWGEMLWRGTPQLPLMSPFGFLILAALLVATGVVMQRRHAPQWAKWTLGAIVLALPSAAYAGTIAIPNTFSNGTVADAGEVNENLDALVIESNSQDARIISLESSVVHTHPGGDITSQVGDADTVDGSHAIDLEESAEIDAGTLDGLDSTDFASASHTHTYAKVAVVAQSGGDYTDPKAAMDDLASWCGTRGASNPCLVRIIPGVIIVEKQTDPDGSAQSFEFATSYGPNFSLVDDETNNSGPLAPGIYSVSEINIPADWNLTSATCNDGSDPSAINLGPGETIICTFVNEEDVIIPGVIIVEKQTDPDGSTQSFEFATSYGPNFSLVDDETNNSGPLAPGIYSVSEINIPADWHLTSATCNDGSDPSAIDLGPGETCSCVFENAAVTQDLYTEIRVDFSDTGIAPSANWNTIATINNSDLNLIDFDTGMASGVDLTTSGWYAESGYSEGWTAGVKGFVEPNAAHDVFYTDSYLDPGEVTFSNLPAGQYIVEVVTASGASTLEDVRVNGAITTENFEEFVVSSDSFDAFVEGRNNYLIWNNVTPLDDEVSISFLRLSGASALVQAIRLVPEPESSLLSGCALVVLFALARRRRAAWVYGKKRSNFGAYRK